MLLAFYLNVQPIELGWRYRDPQLYVTENYTLLFNLGPNICLDPHCIPNKCDLNS